MNWVRADVTDFGGNLPHARSGHTAVNLGRSKVVVFGGFADKRFLDDISVLDTETKLWFSPKCIGSGSDGQDTPPPRAFHVAVAIDCHMFIFGGRSGCKRLGDFWMLDTDIWQWFELTSFGDLPSPREFSAASSVGNRKVVLCGGWDGKKWLSDVYILDTISLEWTELAFSGSGLPPRCGHTATMVEKRLLVYGGRGGAGQIMGDLWALKGLVEEEIETPGWTQLKLPGQPPSSRCGHTLTSGGHNLLLFGGHGTGGWLSRYDVYYNDCVILDRVAVQWKRLPTNNQPPPARAYHSMTYMGARYLLFGGFDGKNTYGDLWWLVPADDPISTRFLATPEALPQSKPATMSNDRPEHVNQKTLLEFPIVDLQKKLGISFPPPGHRLILIDELDDSEFLELALCISRGMLASRDRDGSIQALRHHWIVSTPSSIPLREVGPLLRDYQRLVARQHMGKHGSGSPQPNFHHFFHFMSATQLRIDDIPKLLDEYKELLTSN